MLAKKFELCLFYNKAQIAGMWMPLKDCLKGPSGQVKSAWKLNHEIA